MDRLAEKRAGRPTGGGVKAAAAKIGKGAEKFALHVKGQELPMHDPRGKTGQGLSFAVSPTGADHIEAPHDTPFAAPGPMIGRIAPLGLLEPIAALDFGPKKVRNYTYLQFIWSLYNSLGVCNFAAGPVWALPLTIWWKWSMRSRAGRRVFGSC